jgi:mRNA interferase MazF
MNPGDIYTVKFNPPTGSTFNNTLPVIILNGGDDRYLRLAIVAPIIDWEDYLDENPFFVSLEPGSLKGMRNKSMIDCYQLRAIDHERLMEKIGTLSSEKMNQIKKSISLILDIEPEHCE